MEREQQANSEKSAIKGQRGSYMKKNRAGRLFMIAIFTVLIVAMTSMSGLSQGKYPERPITIIVGWGAGAQADVFTRLLASGASKYLGQPIMVENKPGGGGLVAAHQIVKAAPDGYTLGTGVSSVFVIKPHLAKINFDPLNDPTQILVFLQYDIGLVVRSDSPWKTWEEFKSYAKRNPGKIRYGTAGVGSNQHLVMEMIGKKEGIKWVHMPFKSGAEPVIMLLGGHVEAAIQGPSDVLEHIKAGKFRFLLALNAQRWSIAPEAPHVGEFGYPNNFSLLSIWGPKGLPESIRSNLENVFHKAMEDKAIVETGRKLQQTLTFVDGKSYSRMLKERSDGYKKIIKDLGLEETS